MGTREKHPEGQFGSQPGRDGGFGSDDDKKDAGAVPGVGSEEIESPDENEEPGEGNRQADRRYRDATEKFVAGGGVEPAADKARRAVDDESERRDLQEAERIGRSHSKE
jgi:hypothetical protein